MIFRRHYIWVFFLKKLCTVGGGAAEPCDLHEEEKKTFRGSKVTVVFENMDPNKVDEGSNFLL